MFCDKLSKYQIVHAAVVAAVDDCVKHAVAILPAVTVPSAAIK